MRKKILCIFIIIFFLFIYPISANINNDVLEPDKPGQYKIGYYKIKYNDPTYGVYKATVRYPAKFNGYCTPKEISDSPYPGIVVANGFGGSEWNIKWIPKHLTSYGYITICFTPPHKFSGDTTQWANGFIKGIETLKSQNELWYSPISGILNTEIFGCIGLSMGGGGCIEATGSINSEIDASVALAPSRSESCINAARNIIVPIQIQVGDKDTMVPPERVLPYYVNFFKHTINKEYISINGGNHIGYVDEFFARFAEWIGLDGSKDIEFKEQRRISKRYFTSWFQYHLKDLDEYYTFIFGDEAQSDFGNGILSDLRFNII